MKKCYVISPISRDNSEIRKRSDAVLDLIIKPVAESVGYTVIRGDLIQDEMTIPDSISQHIFNDQLVIADLTDCNPNVFYELGKRHAWGGRCVHLTSEISELPFDIRHQRVIEYNLSDPDKLNTVRSLLLTAIKAIEDIPIQCPFPLTPEKVIELSGSTVVIERYVGHREHYYLAKRMADSFCKRIFLMQRSSSMILGPEQGWGAEKSFYHAILDQINEGVEFYHIVSMEGISRHLKRPNSFFPNTKDALAILDSETEQVGIKGANKVWYFKRIKEEDADLKPDRQARTFLVELQTGETEGIVVVDLGGIQTCFRMRGPIMSDFMHTCIDFYEQCDYLIWSNLRKILKDAY